MGSALLLQALTRQNLKFQLYHRLKSKTIEAAKFKPAADDSL